MSRSPYASVGFDYRTALPVRSQITAMQVEKRHLRIAVAVFDPNFSGRAQHPVAPHGKVGQIRLATLPAQA